jgi:hypothetical protein
VAPRHDGERGGGAPGRRRPLRDGDRGILRREVGEHGPVASFPRRFVTGTFGLVVAQQRRVGALERRDDGLAVVREERMIPQQRREEGRGRRVRKHDGVDAWRCDGAQGEARRGRRVIQRFAANKCRDACDVRAPRARRDGRCERLGLVGVNAARVGRRGGARGRPRRGVHLVGTLDAGRDERAHDALAAPAGGRGVQRRGEVARGRAVDHAREGRVRLLGGRRGRRGAARRP